MTGPEIVEFMNVLNAAFVAADLRTLLMGLNQRFDDLVAAQAPYPEQIQQLVGTANSRGWIGTLVLAVVKARGQTQVVRTFLQNNPDWDPANPSAPSHPCDALRVLGGKCFINRKELRTFLKAMNTTTGRKVLKVTSEERKVGKSYSRELIDFLSMSAGVSGVVTVDLDKDDYEPDKLANEIAKGMGIVAGHPGHGQQQAPRTNKDLVEWLVPNAPIPAAATVWWIVLDGFRQKVPSEAAQDFIAQLAQRVQSTALFRLVLLNYSYRLPLAVEAFVFNDIIHPLSKDDVTEYLSKVHKAKHGTEPPPKALKDYVTGVYGLVAKYERDYPEAVGDQLLINMAVCEVWEVIHS